MRSGFAVRVPGSTSNLGPGFDFLGLCLDLPLEAEARPHGAGPEHRVVHASPVPWAPDDDLVLHALAEYARRTGDALPPLEVRVRSEIPVGRGFGSSGAAVAAALLLAAAFDGGAPREGLVDVALALEGHPDNGTALLLGGCTLSVPHGGRATVVRQPVHDSLGFAVAWPAEPLFTARARAVLPRDVPFADAVENPRRLALLLEGLRTGAAELLALGVVDRLHERFRRTLVAGADAACAAARDAGAYAACLSGAGSGLVAIGPAGAMDEVARALAAPLVDGTGRAVDVVREAPVVRALD